MVEDADLKFKEFEDKHLQYSYFNKHSVSFSSFLLRSQRAVS